MPNSYLPKLSPTVGGGLPGLPERVAGAPVRGEITFPAGMYEWIVPENVTKISVVCLGAGAGGGCEDSYQTFGGGGGALAWVNDIPVTPGETLLVQAGRGGFGNLLGSVLFSYGSDSTLHRDTTMLCGAGGGTVDATPTNGSINPGGSVLVGSGGSGGDGRNNILANSHSQGGGGAGGYTGDGGDSAVGDTDTAGSNGSGGGGAGGANISSGTNGAQAGGVGLFGEGTSGVGALYTVNTNDINGSGFEAGYDSTGATGQPIPYLSQSMSSLLTHVANQGAGGAGRWHSTTSKNGQAGGNGAVRIIWGEGRAFPSTDVGRS